MATVVKRTSVKTAGHKTKSTNIITITDHACMVVNMATGNKPALNLIQKDVLDIFVMRQMEYVPRVVN